MGVVLLDPVSNGCKKPFIHCSEAEMVVVLLSPVSHGCKERFLHFVGTRKGIAVLTEVVTYFDNFIDFEGDREPVSTRIECLHQRVGFAAVRILDEWFPNASAPLFR
jgi:hypothetical protein